MRVPTSPRGWLLWAIRVRELHHSPWRIRLERTGRRDRRMDDSYETAISVLNLLEQSSNGTGPEGVQLVLDVAMGVLPWLGLTEKEQDTVVMISRRFAKALREEGVIRTY